jgi:hypothetical protein
MSERIYTLPDGQRIVAGVQFECDGQTYPAQWLDNAAPDDLEARGIVVETVDISGTPTAVPYSVTDLQARLALAAAGLLDDVETAIGAADRTTQVWWDRALTIRRDSVYIASIGAALGLSEAQIDGLFIDAASR